MPTTSPDLIAVRVTPYLTVHDGPGALAFYVQAFGAVEAMRVVGDDGRLGHAEFTVGQARFYLSDEFPEMGVVSPHTLGGSSVALHLEVGDVDNLYARAVSSGATSLSEPADQPHGARHGTLADPFGHRWMLSQQVEAVGVDAYAERMAGSEWDVQSGASAGASSAGVGGIWASVNCHDAMGVIRFMVDVLGFTEQLVVPGDEPEMVVHSQISWPEGGIVQVGSANRPDNVFSQRPVGSESIYVITADPTTVLERCRTAGAEIVVDPVTPDYDPTGMAFTVKDPEGNLWSFGTYAGEA